MLNYIIHQGLLLSNFKERFSIYQEVGFLKV